MRHHRATAWLAVPCVLFCLPALAQTVTGTVQGTVSDTSGGRIPGVTIELRSLETGLLRSTTTNAEGLYQVAFVPLGRYRLTSDMAGFGRKTRELEVRLNATVVVDLTLAPAVEEEVLVIADIPQVNVTSGEIKSALTSEQIMERPTVQNINNVNTFLSLAETFPGFQENPTSGQNNPTASSGSSINFNGTGTRGSTFQINGVNNDDYSENQNRQGVPLATIKEFQVISHNYSAEFGRGTGAVVLVQTKQGGNEVHGEAYYYRQDSDWNAKNTFALVKPVNSRNQWGGVVGFPVVKNRLFAFASLEHARQVGQGTYARDIFTAADLARPRLTRGNDTAANRAFIDSVLARFGSLSPNDPRSTRTYSGVQEFDRPVRDYSFRLDYELSPRDHLTARWQYSRQIFDNQDIIAGEATRQNNRQQNFGLTWTRNLSSRATAEFRYGLGIRDTNVDVKAGNDTPIIRFSGTPVSGSIIGNAGTFPIARDQRDHQVVGNVTTLLGNRHALKLGLDFRFSSLDDVAQSFNRPFWTFTTSCGGVSYPSPYAAFLDGCVTTFQRAYGPFFLENRINEYNAYVEDNWKLSPALTLNLGVRWEVAGAPREKEDRVDYVYGTDANNVEPRVGFAWSPRSTGGILGILFGGSGNGSLRGGYGLFHGRVFQSVFSQTGASVRTNPPNAIALTFTNQLNVSDPTNGYVFVPGIPTVRHTLTVVEPDLHMPWSHQWNLTFERKVPWNSSIRVSYTGTRTKDDLRFALDNLPLPPGQSPYRVAADYLCAGTGQPGIPPNATCPVAVPIAADEISARVPRTNERRPDARYNTNLRVANDAERWYDGVQVEWIKRFSHGLDFQMSYTRSVAEDTTSEATFVGAGDSNQLGPDKRLARAYSRFHTPHRFTFNGSYALPFFKDRKDALGQVLGGWRLAAVVKIASGTPFTVIDSGAIDTNFDGFAEGRPVLLDPSLEGVAVTHPSDSTQVLARDRFRRATPADYGNLAPRNAFFTDGVRNVDLSLGKYFDLVRGQRLMVRLEAYNVFNRVQYGFPVNDFASTTFGRIVSTSNQYTPRTLQVLVRYVF